ncbi:hypothetical protein [Cesiribacter andamanensis]|uniref:Uncharacterized protein n=1 Tax=Cesiribacter andamanensis AMV16 TaxID=1279009 RepID=M7N5U2_9BACT|nr:hypothetical protein [Cesiribacter andamanensis]EMR02606.1 hypothetical protein ADICEAN_02262 [Cesiribacter andamanensis AMV16]
MIRLYIVLLTAGLLACSGGNSEIEQVDALPGGNPAAEGFDQEGSDSLAIAWADAVMQAQGGRQAWNQTRYLGWTFFGRRHLLWDKHTGRVRIEIPADSSVFLINIQQDTGRVMQNGRPLTDPEQLKQAIDRGKQIWVNDSYWLVMPFKLKDSGVTLTYAGSDTLPGGDAAEVLEMRFKEVGYTPQNKYRVYVDPADSLVKAWAYYEKAEMDTPNFMTPWTDYQRHGALLLSGNRGERQLTNIRVEQEVEERVFQEF